MIRKETREGVGMCNVYGMYVCTPEYIYVDYAIASTLKAFVFLLKVFPSLAIHVLHIIYEVDTYLLLLHVRCWRRVYGQKDKVCPCSVRDGLALHGLISLFNTVPSRCDISVSSS